MGFSQSGYRHYLLARSSIGSLATLIGAAIFANEFAGSQTMSTCSAPHRQDTVGSLLHDNGKPVLRKVMEDILRSTSHFGDDSQCNPMVGVVVTKVVSVNNPPLWHEYCGTCDTFALKALTRGHSLTPMMRSKATETLQKACGDNLFWTSANRAINEVWAFHGTKMGLARNIAATGFDPKRCLNGYYGRGFYLAQESCKSFQYTDAGKFGNNGQEGCILLCRVALGEPDHVTRPDSSKRTPEGACDSVVVNPAAEGGPPHKQHQELLIFDRRQAYPEFIIHFRIPSMSEQGNPASHPAHPFSSYAPQAAGGCGHNFDGDGDCDDDFDDGVDDFGHEGPDDFSDDFSGDVEQYEDDDIMEYIGDYQEEDINYTDLREGACDHDDGAYDVDDLLADDCNEHADLYDSEHEFADDYDDSAVVFGVFGVLGGIGDSSGDEVVDDVIHGDFDEYGGGDFNLADGDDCDDHGCDDYGCHDY